MRVNKIFISLLFAAIALCSSSAYCQDSIEVITVKDTMTKRSFFKKIYNYFADANKQSNKKFDISFIGGPHYSSDTKLGLGLVASGLYSTDRNDSLTPVSNVSLTGDVTTTGFYLLGINGNHIFPRAKWRIDYVTYFFSFPSLFWGLGYDAGNNNDNSSDYLRLQAIAKADFLHAVLPNLYIGPTLGFDYVRGSKFENEDLLGGRQKTTRAFHYGFMASYDSRDFILNAYKGIYAMIRQRNYTYFSKKPFFSTTLQFDYYQMAWKGAVFAFDAYAQLSYGATPWSMMAPIGGTNRMRGYYEGRYRDDNMITTQLECRQRIYRRIGIVGWIGAGTIWGQANAFSWQHILPNFGTGLRWEFKNRVNVRLDWGFGKKGQNGFMFGINEAF